MTGVLRILGQLLLPKADIHKYIECFMVLQDINQDTNHRRKFKISRRPQQPQQVSHERVYSFLSYLTWSGY
jgi:hypothetical protein